MSQQKPPSAPDSPQGDPWHAFGYLVSGVLVYGLVGALLDHWLGTSFIVAIGILLGAVTGVYMTWARFNRAGNGEPPEQGPDEHPEGQHGR